MTNEKRFVLFVTLVFFWMLTTSYLFPARKRPQQQPAAEGKVDEKPAAPDLKLAKAASKNAEPAQGTPKSGDEKSKDAAQPQAKPGAPGEPAKPAVAMVNRSELVLGSLTDKSAGDFLMEVQLEQKGAGIESVYSSRYLAERDMNGGRGVARQRPLQLFGDSTWPPSLALTLSNNNAVALPIEAPRRTTLKPTPCSARRPPMPKTRSTPWSGRSCATTRAALFVR